MDQIVGVGGRDRKETTVPVAPGDGFFFNIAHQTSRVHAFVHMHAAQKLLASPQNCGANKVGVVSVRCGVVSPTLM